VAIHQRDYGYGRVIDEDDRSTPGIISKIESITRGDAQYRTALEQVWFINHINYVGFQWTLVDDSGVINEMPNEVRFRANKIQPSVVHSVAKLTGEPPDWDVDSDTDGRSVQAAKRVAEKFLEYIWDKENMQLKGRELATFIRVYGTGLIGPLWDPEAGRKIEPEDLFPEGTSSEEDIEAVLGAFDGDEQKALDFLQKKKAYYEGDIKIRVINPFDCYVDDAGEDEEAARWVLISSVEGIDEVKARWGKAAKNITAESIGDSHGPSFKYRLRQMVSPNIASGGTSYARIENAVIVNEYWERPGEGTPDGRLVIYASGVVLHDGPNPFAHTTAEIPICRARDAIVPGRFWGQAATESAIPVQRNYNKARSDLIQNSHDHGANKWLSPRGAGLLQGAIDRSSSEVIEYNPVSMGTGAPLKPERIPPGMVSPLHGATLEMCGAEMDEFYGLSEVSRGSAPTGVSAGVALDIILREADNKIAVVLGEMTSCYARLGKQVLDIAKRFIKDDRTFLEIVGPGQSPDVLDFTGEDLSWRNVRVRMGLLVQRRRLRRQQSAIELLQYGGIDLFNTQQAKSTLFKAANLEDALVSSETVDEKRAKKIIADLRQGIPQEMLPWQNNEVILEALREWMNSLDFDSEPAHIQELAVQHFMERFAELQASLLPPPGMEQPPPQGDDPNSPQPQELPPPGPPVG